MAVDTKSELVVDRSAHGELLRINFNISFPALSCEFATLDVSDALGTVRRRRICGTFQGVLESYAKPTLSPPISSAGFVLPCCCTLLMPRVS